MTALIKIAKTKAYFFIFALMLTSGVRAQDSVSTKGWSVESKKISEGKYELDFKVAPLSGKQLYSPNISVDDFKTSELIFSDSLITQEGPFTFSVQPKLVKTPLSEDSAFGIFESPVIWKAVIQIKGTVPAKLHGTLTYSFGAGLDEFQPSNTYAFSTTLEGGADCSFRMLIPSIDIEHPVEEYGDDINKNSSMLAIFLLGLLGGFVALLTPCVFPMIPLTVSFFTKQSENKGGGIKKAFLYGFFIFLIYVLFTIPFHIAGHTNPEVFNNISTGVGLNLFFFVIFIVFALSFFGLYELTLPSSVANKMNAKAGIGSIAGIFFMALTLAIVSFSCTGPVFGTFLASVLEQGAWPLTAAAAGFGVALGLPFALFAMFPNWLKKVPKSGGWMTDIKVVLGFVELALAVKFLANADNVKQWGILKREVFIAIWIVIGVCIVLYLLGILKKRSSGVKTKFTPVRIFFIAMFAAFTIYLVPGLFNTPAARLKLISGFPPPVCYSVYSAPINCDKPLLDYEEAIQLAKQKNKPVLIDFTGWACVNCRRMEEKVWTNPKVEKMMKEDYILVSLYVDEKLKLPSCQQMVYKTKDGVEKHIVTVGDKWATFQLENFHATSQPQYAIISPDEKALLRTKFYTPSAAEFLTWLQHGLDAFKKHSSK
ncbi:MAG: thioredoxin family protein [Bacteroidetes bacterium]|nr:thioredoxin family protein [Bacteroidota bacterium]